MLSSGGELALPTSASPAISLTYSTVCTSLCFGGHFAVETKMWDLQLEATIHYESMYSIPWPTGRMLGGTPQLHGGA